MLPAERAPWRVTAREGRLTVKPRSVRAGGTKALPRRHAGGRSRRSWPDAVALGGGQGPGSWTTRAARQLIEPWFHYAYIHIPR